MTGASRGLGYEIALALAEAGSSVYAVARSLNELLVLQARNPRLIRVSECDMMDFEAVMALPRNACDIFGNIDIVVNNAGIAPAENFIDQNFEEWNNVFSINVTAPAMLTKAAGAYMIAQGSGKVINIASISGIRGKASLVAYSASKGAMLQFTKSLAAEWAKFGIQVNAIAPGAFNTEAQSSVLESPEILERRIRKIPSRRMGNSSEMGALVCYLASPKSDFVTGSVMVIDGGETAKL